MTPGFETSSSEYRPQTFAQKALARAAGFDYVEISQVVDARPDVVLSHDNTAAIRRIWQQFGQERVLIPDRLAITLDHAVPAPTTKHAQNHAEIRQFVAEQGIRNFFEVGRGICHQVLSEEAIVLPGQLILGADSHTTHYGWLGAFGAGIGRSEVATLWATGELWLRVPESMLITLEGELPPGVTAKDFALRVIGDLGADGGLYMSIEFTGSGISAMSLESRMVIPNMMAEFGAKNAYLAPDEQTVAYLAERLAARLARQGQQAECRRPRSPDHRGLPVPGRRRHLCRALPLPGRAVGDLHCLPAHDGQRGAAVAGGGHTHPAGLPGHVHQRPPGRPGRGRGRDSRQAGGTRRALYRHPGIEPGAQGGAASRATSRTLSRQAP